MPRQKANKCDRDLIIGGDFNSPPDRILRADLQLYARDAFAECGRGWGGTAINSCPLVRIDQIWLGGNLVAKHAYAKTTVNSDHRMVVVTATRRE